MAQIIDLTADSKEFPPTFGTFLNIRSDVVKHLDHLTRCKAWQSADSIAYSLGLPRSWVSRSRRFH
jgi:hypothetical protein